MIRLLFMLVFLMAQAAAGTAQAKPLVSDISSHSITIHTAFEGTELMLFGARGESGDIVVVVRGPEFKTTVRRKEKVWGMWINREKEKFYHVPGFYALASSRPFEEISKSIYFRALGIGYEDAIRPYFPPLTDKVLDIDKESREREFAHALLRFLRTESLYSRTPGTVQFMGETLFKTTIPFPDNMPRGVYTAEVYLFSEGELIGMQSTPIQVKKSGFDAFVYEAAQERGYIYGMIAIALALLFGWSASVLFQRI